ncbi:sensor histidine kinase [Paenibacillus piri]|uniref:histidine kinase n=1 Tax=Paenibacillus piri TaxID=2547395 RepID=A0A4R5KPZ1_9BACL|nr:HAMP domain-containing sensor histidine kinase [Paenibacillus piri]TDF97065.1 HAMP domain-containing histidine kinase [Paenibacillus piri]
MIKLKGTDWSRSLRVKLVLAFGATLVLTTMLNLLFDYATRELRKVYYTSYETSKQNVTQQLSEIEQQLPALAGSEQIDSLLKRESEATRLRILLADMQGIIVYRSPSVTEDKIDLYQIVYEQKETENRPEPGKTFTAITPVQYQDRKLFLVVSGPLIAEQGYRYENPRLYSVFVFLLLFLLLFYLFTYNKMKEIRIMSKGVQQIARGKLSIRLPVKSRDELGTLTESINEMVRQLEETIVKERLAEQSKSELITNISHDLRTPLTSIIGYLTVLIEHPATDGALRPYVTSALNKSNQLKNLIDDLFEYTRLTSNQVALDKSRVDLVGMLNQIIMELVPLAEQHQVSVNSTLPDRKVEAFIDADKIVRAIDNLLTNALKFSVKPGSIDIKLHAEHSWAVLSIANTGLSITPEQEKRLFDRFYKADESRNDHRMPHGSGLGLSIAQSIVQLHEGNIWMQRTGPYYEFFVRLPLPL